MAVSSANCFLSNSSAAVFFSASAASIVAFLAASSANFCSDVTQRAPLTSTHPVLGIATPDGISAAGIPAVLPGVVDTHGFGETDQPQSVVVCVSPEVVFGCSGVGIVGISC